MAWRRRPGGGGASGVAEQVAEGRTASGQDGAVGRIAALAPHQQRVRGRALHNKKTEPSISHPWGRRFFSSAENCKRIAPRSDLLEEAGQVLFDGGGRRPGQVGLDGQVLEGGRGVVFLDEGVELGRRPLADVVAQRPSVVGRFVREAAAPAGAPDQLAPQRRETRHLLLLLPATATNASGTKKPSTTRPMLRTRPRKNTAESKLQVSEQHAWVQNDVVSRH